MDRLTKERNLCWLKCEVSGVVPKGNYSGLEGGLKEPCCIASLLVCGSYLGVMDEVKNGLAKATAVVNCKMKGK